MGRDLGYRWGIGQAPRSASTIGPGRKQATHPWQMTLLKPERYGRFLGAIMIGDGGAGGKIPSTRFQDEFEKRVPGTGGGLNR